MKKLLNIFIILLWLGSLAILILALTDIYPYQSLQDHRIIIGIYFISITGLIRNFYKKKMGNY